MWVPGNYHWPVIPALRRIRPSLRPKIVAQVSAALRKPQRGPLRQIGFDTRMRHLLRGTEAAVTLALTVRHEARQILRHERVAHIPLPALEAFASPPLPMPAGPLLILGAGRLVPEKGFANLIAAFARVEDGQATLVIAGEGPERQNLLALARSLGVAARVHLPGYVPNIRPLLDEAHLFVLASDYEGYAAVLIEALEAGRPVVSTDCTPATADLFRTEGAGQTVPVGDVSAMADAIAEMLARRTPDPRQLAAIANPFRIDGIARDYLALFDDVCSRETSRRPWRRWRVAPSDRAVPIELAS